MELELKEKFAHDFCEAIKKLASNEDALNNMESYLSHHFDTWMEKWANTPAGLTWELEQFAKIHQ